MEVAIIADTHIPDREQSIPDPFRERIREADHVIHAGDFTSAETLAEVRDLATNLTAVEGNMEREGIDLPRETTVDLVGVNVAVTHGWLLDGKPIESGEEWLDAVAGAAAALEEPRVAIGAHTHQAADTTHDGVRVLNPGTATGADPATDATMMTATVAGGEFDVTVHELD